jgi:hypothetical protein
MATSIQEVSTSGEKLYKGPKAHFFIFFKMKKIIMLIVIILSLIIPTVSAEFWLCLEKTEMVRYCNDYKPPFTCDSNLGCQRCMSRYDEIDNCYVHGTFQHCQNMGQLCSFLDKNHSIDSEPPELTVNSPVEGMYYNSRSVPFNVEVNEYSDLYYYDHVNGRDRWIRFCDECLESDRTISLQEGFNNISIRANDVIGNPSYLTVSFHVDSIKPKIYATFPEDGDYGNGIFSVTYTEEELQNITLFYKTNGIWASMTQSCTPGSRITCEFDAGLPPGEFPLTYYFAVSDKATTVYSEDQTIFIDTIAPEMEVVNPHNPMVVYGSRKVLIEINVNEEVKLEYLDQGGRRLRWTKLCKNCDSYYKTKTFKDGFHNVTFRATDKGGNSVDITRIFLVDSKKPKIKKIDPRRGFSNGLLSVEFKEVNPKTLTLHFGDDVSEFGSLPVDIDDSCYQHRRGYSCDVFANFVPYDD